MTINELFELKDKLNAEYDTANQALVAACKPHKIQMGLISDEYRSTNEYKQLKAASEFYKQQMRTFWMIVRGNKEFAKADRERTLAKRYANVR